MKNIPILLLAASASGIEIASTDDYTGNTGPMHNDYNDGRSMTMDDYGSPPDMTTMPIDVDYGGEPKITVNIRVNLDGDYGDYEGSECS